MMFRLSVNADVKATSIEGELTFDPAYFETIAEALEALGEWENDGFWPVSNPDKITKLTVTIEATP